jgi:hypothetical protein
MLKLKTNSSFAVGEQTILESRHPRRLFITASQPQLISFPVRVRQMRLARVSKGSQQAGIISTQEGGTGPWQAFSL